MFSKLPHARMAFICYRRDDLKGMAAAINLYLKKRFPGQIWFDTDPDGGIPAGKDWQKTLTERAGRCSVLLVLIGPGWNVKNPEGGLKIADPQDWVHREILAAQVGGAEVIPVPLDTVSPQNVAFPSAINISAKQWGPQVSANAVEDDCARLARKIRKFLVSPLYCLNLTLLCAGAAYFVLWLRFAAARPGLALSVAAVAALLVTVLSLSFFKQRVAIQTVRACLSNRAALLPAAVLAVLPLLIVWSTPTLLANLGTLRYEAMLDGRPIASEPSSDTARIAGFPLWGLGPKSQTVQFVVPGYPNLCETATPEFFPFSTPRMVRDKLGRNAAIVRPSPKVCEAVNGCSARNCTEASDNAIRMAVELWQNGEPIDSTTVFYRGQALWVAGKPGQSPAVPGCALAESPESNQTPIQIGFNAHCGLNGPMELRYRLYLVNSGRAYDWVSDIIGNKLVKLPVKPAANGELVNLELKAALEPQ